MRAREIDGVPTLYLYGEIGFDVTAASVRDAISDLPEGNEVDIRINSPGGSVFEAEAIYNQLSRISGKKTVHIDGLAASAATYIMLVGDTIRIASNGRIMVHEISGGGWGTATELKRQAELMDKITDQWIAMYARRTGLNEQELRDMLAATTWMTAKEAVEKGFADEIAEEVLAMNREFRMAASLSPKDLREMYTSDTTTHDMDIKAMARMLGMDSASTEAQVTAAFEAKLARLDQVEAELKALNAQAQKDAESRAEALVATAIQERRITASDKQEYVDLAMTNYGLAQKTLARMPAPPRLPSESATAASGNADGKGRENWNYKEWSQKDPEGLKNMKRNEPERFQELLENFKRNNPV